MAQSAGQIWNACLDKAKAEVSPTAYNRWFKPIKAIKIEGHELTIQVPNPFFFEYLEEHFIDVLKRIISEVIGPKGRLKYQILMQDSRKSHQAKQQSEELDMTPGAFDKSLIKNPFVVPGIKKARIDHNLVGKYRFDNYLEGSCNQLARAAGINIAQNPGKTAFNPLIIYGGVGLGKTHLIHAIGNEILSNFSNKHVYYASTEKFTNQIIQSIKNKSTDELVAFYQQLDVVIIDDIQFFAGRDKTQEIFFHIFNHIHNKGGQIIMTSDKAPSELQGLEERLINRFKWGLVTDIQPPDFETRMAILSYKLEEHNLDIPNDCMEYICYNIDNNIRELEGVVVSLLAQIKINGAQPTLPIIKQLVTRYINHNQREISLDSIMEIVADQYDIPVDKIISTSRVRQIVLARQLSMYLTKKLTKSSLKDIGEQFGGKHHTTVLYAIESIKNLMKTDGDMRNEIVALERRIEMTMN